MTTRVQLIVKDYFEIFDFDGNLWIRLERVWRGLIIGLQENQRKGNSYPNVRVIMMRMKFEDNLYRTMMRVRVISQAKVFVRCFTGKNSFIMKNSIFI